MSSSKGNKRRKCTAVGPSKPSVAFDDERFISKAAETHYEQVLKHEELVESLFFDLNSLKEVGLDLEPRFESIGIDQFVSKPFPIYEEPVREFYANLTHSVNDFGEIEIESMANGNLLQVTETDMFAWFALNPNGYKCMGTFDYDVDDFNDSTTDPEMTRNKKNNKMFALNYLREQSKTRSVDYNAYGVEMRMIHTALTRCITPKVHTQVALRGMDQEIMYHLLRGNQVNFCHAVLYYMISKTKFMSRDEYKSGDRERKSGIPFGSILTRIFEMNGQDLSVLPSIKIHRNQLICNSHLKTMKYFRTRDNGWVFYRHIEDDTVLEDGTVYGAVVAPHPPPVGQAPPRSCIRPFTSSAPPPSDLTETASPTHSSTGARAPDHSLLALHDRMTTLEREIGNLRQFLESEINVMMNLMRQIANKVGCTTDDTLETPLATYRRRGRSPT